MTTRVDLEDMAMLATGASPRLRGIRRDAAAPGSIRTHGAVAITAREAYERRGGGTRRLGREKDQGMAVFHLPSGEIRHVDGGLPASA